MAERVPAAELNRLVERGARKADKIADRLANLLEPILNGFALQAARNFEQRATDHLIAAGTPEGNPSRKTPETLRNAPRGFSAAADWIAPGGNELIDADEVVGRLKEKTDPVRRAFLEAQMTPALKAAGLSFDVTNPHTARVLEQSGSQVTHIAKTTQLNVNRIIRKSYEAGLSIPDTATAIRVGMREANKARATLIARTELAGAVNGGSLAATRIIGQATGTTYTKVWMTAFGARHPRHATYPGLDGQEVPLDQPFDVGGESLDHPGDPAGSPSEVCNCRCAVSYNEGALDTTGPADEVTDYVEPAAVETEPVEPVEEQPTTATLGALPKGKTFVYQGHKFRVLGEKKNGIEVQHYKTKAKQIVDPKLTVDLPGATKAQLDTRLKGASLRKEFEAQKPSKIPLESKEALKSYAGDGYMKINGALRKSGGKVVGKFAQAIDKAFETVDPISGDAVVYRTVKNSRTLAKIKEGDIVQDHGYTSTSAARSAAEGFKGLEADLLEITLPKGAKGLDINKIISGASFGGEREILLPRGARFVIESISYRPNSQAGARLIRARVLLS